MMRSPQLSTMKNYCFHVSRFTFPVFLLVWLMGCGNSTPLPPLVTERPFPAAYTSLSTLTTLTVPPRDLLELTEQLKGIEAPQVAQMEPTAYQMGETAVFWVKNLAQNSVEQVEATLAYRSDLLNLWVETGETVKENSLVEAAQVLESHILPTNRAFFGTEWQPGVDGDPRLNILHVADLQGVGVAYFSSSDEYVTAVHPYSNQRELLTVSLDALPVGGETYYHTIAHELQHLIHWHTDPNEDAWLNEGLSELAAHLNGYATNREAVYADQPDIQLTYLSQQPDVVGSHYAAAFLFSAYFLDRFGEQTTQALVRQPANSLAGIEAALQGQNLTAEQLFADWLVANYLEGVGQEQGVYQYTSLELPELATQKIGRSAATTSVSQFGADYWLVENDEPVTVAFTGTQQVSLASATPHSGEYVYYSYPADESAVSMTRSFDLSGLTAATLTFWAWYDIEEGWDYGYVAVSADEGQRWTLLETDSTTTENPQGNSFGPGYTGSSGGWVQQTADLTPFAGQSIQLRFWYITDSAVHQQGFLVDDIAIPQLGYLDSAESETDWQLAGFGRTTLVLPQLFLVQHIYMGPDGVQVEELFLDENQQGRWELPAGQTVLVVSGITPVTTETAVYQITQK